MESTMGHREATFREYLANSGACEEFARVLVGLEEASNRPEDPVGFIRTHFDKDLPDIVKQERLDVEAMLAENEVLLARKATLSAELADIAPVLGAREAEFHAPLLDQLVAMHADAGDAEALDASKLYTAVSARFPEVEDAPWAAEAFEPPAGAFSRAVLDEWVRRCCCWGGELQATYPGLTLQVLLELSEGGDPMDPEMAAGVFAACMLLPTIEVEQGTEY